MEQLNLNFGSWSEPPQPVDGVRDSFVEDFEVFQSHVSEFAEARFGADQGLYEQAVICAVHAVVVMLRLGSTDEDIMDFFQRMVSCREKLLVPSNYREQVSDESMESSAPTLRGADVTRSNSQ